MFKLPKIVDLFSGCGGLALGFEKAEFDIVAGIELVPAAVKTISYNLCWRYGRRETHICGDIKKIDGTVFNDKIGEEGCVVIGGPPCQAYSMAGRGKLHSLGEERININDPRGYLYQDFLRFVFAMDARGVVMENVPESVNFGGRNIPQIVCEELENKGYIAYWTILNAADYGIPQVRERVFVIAIKKDEKKSINLPIPTHRNKIDINTKYQRRFESYKKYKNFKMPIDAKEAKNTWVTVGEAFSDLPKLFPTFDSKYRMIPLNIEMSYETEIKNSYQELMRNWYGKKNNFVSGNAFRKNVRDFQIFARMKQGDNYIDASKIADEIFNSELELYGYKEGTEEYDKLKKEIVPGYDRNKFENRWQKLNETKPSHTIIAHLSKDTYTHIHPWEPRGISVREAARIQSFPDDFYFDCSMGEAYRQIGNAVPPLLAFAIAKSIKNTFEEEY